MLSFFKCEEKVVEDRLLKNFHWCLGTWTLRITIFKIEKLEIEIILKSLRNKFSGLFISLLRSNKYLFVFSKFAEAARFCGIPKMILFSKNWRKVRWTETS